MDSPEDLLGADIGKFEATDILNHYLLSVDLLVPPEMGPSNLKKIRAS